MLLNYNIIMELKQHISFPLSPPSLLTSLEMRSLLGNVRLYFWPSILITLLVLNMVFKSLLLIKAKHP